MLQSLATPLLALTWQQTVMIGVGLALMYMAIARDLEPNLLLPMGFGTLLVNLPLSSALTQGLTEGALSMLFRVGIETELFPLLIFIAVGAMCDFTPLLTNPRMFLFGLTAQAGIFLTMGLALFLGFDLHEAASIGIIGAADGPTSIYVSNRFAPHLLGPISVAAYTYMALVPLIQPPVIRLLTSRKERAIKMAYAPKPVSRRGLVSFPSSSPSSPDSSPPPPWPFWDSSCSAIFSASAAARSASRGRPKTSWPTSSPSFWASPSPPS